MIHSPPRLETDIAEAIIDDYLRTDPLLAVRRCLVLVHPEHGQVEIDAVFCKTESDSETFTILETKRKLRYELVGDISRWFGWAPWLAVGYGESKRVGKVYIGQINRLSAYGVRRHRVAENGAVTTNAGYARPADPRLVSILSAAFHASTGDIDPPAGSAAAKRATPARTAYEGASKLLRETKTIDGKYAWMTWVSIQHELPDDEFVQTTSAGKAFKAVRSKVWMGVELKEQRGDKTLFRWKGRQ